MQIRDIVLYFLNGDEDAAEKFGEWALGPEYQTIDYSKKPFFEIWNELHGEKLKLHPEGNFLEDFEDLINIWKKEVGLDFNDSFC